MAGVQIHDAINPKDDQPQTPMQCWCAQSDAHTAPCGLSLLPGTERQSLLPVAKEARQNNLAISPINVVCLALCRTPSHRLSQRSLPS